MTDFGTLKGDLCAVEAAAVEWGVVEKMLKTFFA